MAAGGEAPCVSAANSRRSTRQRCARAFVVFARTRAALLGGVSGPGPPSGLAEHAHRKFSGGDLGSTAADGRIDPAVVADCPRKRVSQVADRLNPSCVRCSGRRRCPGPLRDRHPSGFAADPCHLAAPRGFDCPGRPMVLRAIAVLPEVRIRSER